MESWACLLDKFTKPNQDACPDSGVEGERALTEGLQGKFHLDGSPLAMSGPAAHLLQRRSRCELG